MTEAAPRGVEVQRPEGPNKETLGALQVGSGAKLERAQTELGDCTGELWLHTSRWLTDELVELDAFHAADLDKASPEPACAQVLLHHCLDLLKGLAAVPHPHHLVAARYTLLGLGGNVKHLNARRLR